MARRCEHCEYFMESVFAGETESGWGSWYGDCFVKERGFSLAIACSSFKQKPPCHHFSKLPGTACASGACDYVTPWWVARHSAPPPSIHDGQVATGVGPGVLHEMMEARRHA